MWLSRRWKLLPLLLVGACLPVTLTCDPAAGVLHVGGDWVDDVVVVDDGYYYDDCCNSWDDWRHGFQFDFFHSDD